MQPESGWKRYLVDNKNISYIGEGWTGYTYVGTSVVLQSSKSSNASFQFKFTGSKIRLIGAGDCSAPAITQTVILDGKTYNATMSNAGGHSDATGMNRIYFEMTGLADGEHTIASSFVAYEIVLDAIDIDENGELKPYPPVVTPSTTGSILLRITMNDSSEREYQVTAEEADEFVKWCDRTVDAGSSLYKFDKVVGSQKSKEYLLFEKIISFEVLELN